MRQASQNFFGSKGASYMIYFETDQKLMKKFNTSIVNSQKWCHATSGKFRPEYCAYAPIPPYYFLRFFLVGTLLHQPLSWDADRSKIFRKFIFQYFKLLGAISPLWFKALQWLHQALNWVWKWVVIEISCKSGAETQFFSPEMKIMPIFWWSSFFLSKGMNVVLYFKEVKFETLRL